MKPADCKDEIDLNKLDHTGIGFNDNYVSVKPNIVLLEMGNCSIKIPQRTFRRFAEWYLEEQTKETCDNKKF